MRNNQSPLNSPLDPTKKKWLLEKHKQLVEIFMQIPLAEVLQISKYFATKINYAQFMKYWRSVDVTVSLSTKSQKSNLLELAELGIKLLQKIFPFLEEIDTEIPDITGSDFDEEKLENITELLKQFKASSDKFNIILMSFINEQGNNASVLYPIYRKICADFADYLSKLRIVLVNIIKHLKKLNPSFEGNEIYQQMIAELTTSSAKVIDISDVSVTALIDLSEPEIPIDLALLERGNELQHVLLQRFQSEDESHVPTLHVALQRAAISGSVHDINDLLYFGADINAISNTSGQTALHMAISNGKEFNARCLVANGVNTRIKDFNEDSPLVLAQRNCLSTIIKLLDSHAHSVFSTEGTLISLLKFLPASDLFRLQRVNPQWRNVSARVILQHLHTAGLPQEYIRIYQRLPRYLQYTIIKYAIENPSENKLKELFTILQVEQSSREALLEPITYPRQTHPVHAQQLTVSKISDIGVVLHFTGLLPLNRHFEGIHNLGCLFSEYGCLMLAESLITLNQIERFVHSGSTCGTHSNLNELICKNGYFALKLKLLSADDAPYISSLKALLTDIGFDALKEGLITPAQARQIYHSGFSSGPFDNLGRLLSEEGVIFLRKGYITPEQAAYFSSIDYLFGETVNILFERRFICFKDFPGQKIKEISHLTCQLNLLSSELCLSMFEKGLIDQNNLIKIKNIKPLISPNGIVALSTGLITLEQASKIPDLDSLLSNEGMQALKTGVLTIEQATKHKSLALIRVQNGIKALKKGLITLEQAEKFRNYGQSFQAGSLAVLLSDDGLELLSEGLLTPEQAATFYHSGSCQGAHDNLKDLLTPLAKQALREKLIDPSQASQAELSSMFSRDRTPKILIALKLGLVVLDDFKYGGRFYCHHFHHRHDDLNTKIEKLLQPNETFTVDRDKTNAVITMQSFFRAKQAERKLQLLKTVKRCMQAGRLDQLDQLRQARDSIFNNKPREAKQILAQMDSNRLYIKVPESLRDTLARKMEPLFTQMGEICSVAREAFKRMDYSRTMWELCQIEHPNAELLCNILLKHCKRLGLELNKAYGKKQESALHIIAKKGLVERYNLFVAFGADESLKDADEVTPREYLALHLLLSQGATLSLNK